MTAELKVVEKEGHPATVEGMAVPNFVGAREARDLTEREVVELARAHPQNQMVVLAFHMLRLDKSEMVKKIEAGPELWGVFLNYLESAKTECRYCLTFFDTAQARLLVAGSIVELN
jgi:hypothetical protein